MIGKSNPVDWEDQVPGNIPKRKDQKIPELEQRIKVLEKQKAFFGKQAEQSDM